MEGSKIIIEFTINEAKIVCKAIASSNPEKMDEMISFMLYSRIKHKIEEAVSKNESL